MADKQIIESKETSKSQKPITAKCKQTKRAPFACIAKQKQNVVHVQINHYGNTAINGNGIYTRGSQPHPFTSMHKASNLTAAIKLTRSFAPH